MLKSIKNLNGFSLIEALIATAILALTLVALVGVFPFVLRINKLAEQTTMASNYAKSKLEEILVKPYDEVEVGTIEVRHRLSSDSQDPAYNIERQTVVNWINTNLELSVVDIGLKKITVTIWWPKPNGTDSLVIYSILSQR